MHVFTVVWTCFVKKGFLKLLQNSQENTCAEVSKASKFIKETPAQFFSREFCEMFLNTCFVEHQRKLGSVNCAIFPPYWIDRYTLKANSLYHVGTFLPLQKFKTFKIKLEKNTYTQANTCLLHILRNFKDIFQYIYFTIYLYQTENNWESAIIFIDHRCLPCFVFFFNRY